jgi:hypothetical protein
MAQFLRQSVVESVLQFCNRWRAAILAQDEVEAIHVITELERIPITVDELRVTRVGRVICGNGLWSDAPCVLRDRVVAYRSVLKVISDRRDTLHRLCTQLQCHTSSLGEADPVDVAIAILSKQFDRLGDLDEADHTVFADCQLVVYNAIRALILDFTARGRLATCQSVVLFAAPWFFGGFSRAVSGQKATLCGKRCRDCAVQRWRAFVLPSH